MNSGRGMFLSTNREPRAVLADVISNFIVHTNTQIGSFSTRRRGTAVNTAVYRCRKPRENICDHACMISYFIIDDSDPHCENTMVGGRSMLSQRSKQYNKNQV